MARAHMIDLFASHRVVQSATTGSPLDIAAQRNDAEMIEMIRSHYKDFGQEPPPVPRTSATAAAAPAASPALSSARNETHERRPSGHSHVTKPSSGSEGPTPDHHSSGKRLSGVDIHGERDVEDRTDTEFDDDDDDDLIDGTCSLIDARYPRASLHARSCLRPRSLPPPASRLPTPPTIRLLSCE